jgi:hypothetical protein
MLSILVLSSLTFAKEPDRIHGFRMGGCLGFSTECMSASLTFEYAGKYVGFNLSLPGVPVWAASSVRFYPIPIRHGEKLSWRPYGYVGGAVIIFNPPLVGGGGGADIHLSKSKRLCLQPSLGAVYVVHDPGQVLPSISMAVMYTF